ncbi:Lrp/AsnC family transcriptional regulator [Emcibacter nanhaiensis]|uniref:Lrp/AsnC family transcriptional regulator n=1 Tax=Emcibacter nanhaiensis TaxID=1505037 RepID=A0A501PNM2_9PROT|nr:Lrp/AsnC family transcriptional regulator [Emcibacter nanhaiensis]TPD61692.1 Lrp/AsnC family transcriptional regulator [Emcibacter nanhaiensis]
MQLQDNEKKLLELLKVNSRLSAAELGRKLGLARSTIHMMLQKLEEKVIDSYTVTLKPEADNGNIRCYVMITRDPKKSQEIEQALENMPEVACLSTVAGSFDFIALVHADTHPHLDEVLTKIAMMPGILKTETHIILSPKFDRRTCFT